MFGDIQQLLKKSAKKAGASSFVESSEVLRFFEETISYLGDEFKGLSKAISFENKVLTVAILSSEAEAKIKENEVDLIDKLNDKLGNKLVNRINYLS